MIDALDPRQTVLARLDLNSPVEDGAVQDNHRFQRHAETVRQLVSDDHGVVLLAHQGRPGRDTFVPLEQHAQLLSEHAGVDVRYVDTIDGDAAEQAVQDVEPGEAVLLENVRMSDHELAEREPEQHAEQGFVPQLAAHADAYVNDAYSAAHRPHASLVGFPHALDSYAGPVMEQEYTHNTRIHDHLDEEVAMVVGGKKAGDVLAVMDELAGTVDTFLVGGLIAELFLRAEGHDVGFDVHADETFMHDQWLEHRDTVKRLLDEHGDSIELPRDLAYHNDQRRREEVRVEDAAKEKPYWDVGKETVEAYTPYIRDADAVFVKGAVGVFEDDKFAYGTRTLLEAIETSQCFSVVGGGDTARAVDLFDLNPGAFNHVSIAGGAYIRALTGGELPAVEALQEHG